MGVCELMYRSIRKFEVGDKTYFPGDPEVNNLDKEIIKEQISLGNVIELPKKKTKKKVKDGKDS